LQCDGSTGEKVLYKHTIEAVERIAVTLKGMGIRRGDIVWLHGNNNFDYPLVLFALTSIGAVPANLPPFATGEEKRHSYFLLSKSSKC
jgi:acyl-CoA synthetase (AMP-forming)/AMP-acid ligase II